ncbi:MAG: hypothetical protein J6T38_09815 [Bacteroidaceae bacterium]|nr:hypothetical protein [Bacteroidaceae bacterium]
MKQIKLWMLAAILTICGTAAFASCATNDDVDYGRRNTRHKQTEQEKVG